MSHHQLAGIISETSPGSPATAVSSTTIQDLGKYERITVEATVVGGTGGTTDVYLQRKLTTNLWADWIHFAQAAAATTVKSSVAPTETNTITVVGGGTDAAPGVALAVDTCAGGHPGNEIRAVFVAGAATSAGATQTIRVYGWRR